MAAGKIYTYPENFKAYKALIAAKYSGASVSVASDFTFGETNKSDAFLSKFPLGKVPAYEGNHGVKLFEPNAIAYYVANEAMRGANPEDAAYIQQWIEFADSEILPASCTWVFPCMGIMQYNKQATEKAKEDVKKALSALNDHLLTRTFLVGERITLADIAVCCNLLHLYKWVLDADTRKPYQNVNRWFTTLINQKHFKTVIGDFKLCEKMAQFDAKKFAEMSGGGAKKEKPKKEAPAKKQPAKPKEKAPEPEAADEPPVEKSKDPFADLPKGTMNMDEWKKTYSNEDTESVAIPYFWKNFDKENFSIWRCEYKYPEDLTLTFMSKNLISGMFQRLDRMRKHSFGVMFLLGGNRDSLIHGLWFWRGHDLAFELSPDLQVDYESYDWKKLDPDSEETKKLVHDFWTFEGDFPKPLCEGKVFK